MTELHLNFSNILEKLFKKTAKGLLGNTVITYLMKYYDIFVLCVLRSSFEFLIYSCFLLRHLRCGNRIKDPFFVHKFIGVYIYKCVYVYIHVYIYLYIAMRGGIKKFQGWASENLKFGSVDFSSRLSSHVPFTVNSAF